MIHVYMGGGQYAPCGAKVSSSQFDEPIQPSCGEDFTLVTCPTCMALVAQMVRLYRVATRGRVKWHENPARNVRWDKLKMVKA